MAPNSSEARLIVHWPVIEWSQFSEILRKLTLFTFFLLFQLLPHNHEKTWKTSFFSSAASLDNLWNKINMIMMNTNTSHFHMRPAEVNLYLYDKVQLMIKSALCHIRTQESTSHRSLSSWVRVKIWKMSQLWNISSR